jgi:integrase
MGNPPVKLLDRVRQCIRLKGYSIRTEKSYVSWIKRFVLFHGKRHPRDMGKPEIEAFLSHLVMKRNVASSTQNQAFNAILFLYNHVLDVDMPQNINALRSKKPVRVPTVMTREETFKLIGMMHGTHLLMAKLIYGCGLRVMECIRLRVKDIDFAMNQHDLHPCSQSWRQRGAKSAGFFRMTTVDLLCPVTLFGICNGIATIQNYIF